MTWEAIHDTGRVKVAASATRNAEKGRRIACPTSGRRLAHVTYSRDVDPREIDKPACETLSYELRETWREFRRQLPPVYASEIEREVRKRKEPHPDGTPSEFRNYNLD